MKRVILLAGGLALAACNQTAGVVASATTSDPPPPPNYRDQVQARVKKTFFDPYSIRDAAISQPFVQNAAFDGVTLIPHQGWMVCIRANAKNRMGGYIGLKETGYMFKAGQIVDADFNSSFCAGAQFEPFPEIEEGFKAPPAPTARQRRAG